VSLPSWLDPLFSAEEMGACDRWAIDVAGVPSLDLMEGASLGLARATARLALPGLPIRIIIGPGNNGGDGLAAARLLREEGRVVDVLAVTELDRIAGDARANLDRLPGDPPAPFEPSALAGSGAIVDAVLGTGFSGTPREPIAAAIAAINDEDAPTIACDVPAGVDASTGEVRSVAVQADVTVTFHGPKIGLYVAPGALHAGDVEAVAIGIPRGWPSAATAGLISTRVLDLFPRRQRFGTKFDTGVVAIAGGARGLTGAPAMAALAAARGGAGYVQVAVPASVAPALELRLLEQMVKALPEADGTHTPDGLDDFLEFAQRAGGVVLGPGLDRSESAADFARAVAAAVEVPLLIDADGLNAHAGVLERLAERSAPTLLTPHAAELGRLLDREPDAVDANRLACAREAAERSGAVVLLKGDDTIIAEPGGVVAVNPGATPALATAGTGDVLSGLVGALLAKGMATFEAAALGAFAHADAGRAAAERHGVDHVIAGDVIDALPDGLRSR
jgi:hydroxyethylthiazole kinase-like uncharacterized protein yjeF